MFDCGVNLFSHRFEPETVLGEAVSAGVTGCVIIASTIEESLQAQTFCRSFHSTFANLAASIRVCFTAGVHPHNASSWTDSSGQALREILQDPNCVAVGECGLDFNRNFSTPEQQKHAFIEQLIIASECGKGLYLHQRDAHSKLLELLDEYALDVPFKFAHCFTGDTMQLQGYLARDCFIGITGWICDAKRGQLLRECIAQVPLQRLLFETDAPYLFPKTLKPRQTNNSPKNLSHIIDVTAGLISQDADTLKEISRLNAIQIFSGNHRTQKTTVVTYQ